MRDAICIGNKKVQPGEHALIQLALPSYYAQTEIHMPVHVIHAKRKGPRLFICAAMHGDEVNGVEIIRRLIRMKSLERLCGTLIAVPVVNVYGLMNNSRYLPDRRDLNRSFPGSHKGSLAARLAHLFLEEIVKKSDYGIDIHTGSNHRSNLPQIRANLDHEETCRLARIFCAPVTLHSDIRDGSLRQTVDEMGIPVLLYEAGESMRFSEHGIRLGVQGILHVMRDLEMLPSLKAKRLKKRETIICRGSYWVRASESGVFQPRLSLGKVVQKKDILGKLSDPYSNKSQDMFAPSAGVVVGISQLPLVNEGEALFHIAQLGSAEGRKKDHAEIQEKLEYLSDMFPDPF